MKRIIVILPLLFSVHALSAGGARTPSVTGKYTKTLTNTYKIQSIDIEPVHHLISTQAYVVVKIDGEEYGTINFGGFYGNCSADDFQAYVDQMKIDHPDYLVVLNLWQSNSSRKTELEGIKSLTFIAPPK